MVAPLGKTACELRGIKACDTNGVSARERGMAAEFGGMAAEIIGMAAEIDGMAAEIDGMAAAVIGMAAGSKWAEVDENCDRRSS